MEEPAFFNPFTVAVVSLSGCSYAQRVHFSKCDFETAAERKPNKHRTVGQGPVLSIPWLPSKIS